MNEEEFQEFDEDLPKSKSQIKREMQALKDLGKELVELPASQLEKIPLSEAVRDGITKARAMQYGALKRQLKFIGGLMVHEDEAAIRLALMKIRQPHEEEVSAFHEIEKWRDQLLSGNQQLLNELAQQFDLFERQYVNQLIRNAKKEATNNKPPKSSRLLFKYLKGLQEAE